MDTLSLSSFEGLTEIGMRGKADMRPTLLRVLTDLYVQKLRHTPDEERHYTELALRLLDSVDVPTRLAVAARLAHHLSPPGRVIQKLAADLPEVSAALRSSQRAERREPAIARGERTSLDPSSAAIAAPAQKPAAGRLPAPDSINPDIAGELNELFFAAGAEERQLILRNLHVVSDSPATQAHIAQDPNIGRKLEAAALARRREDFVRELAHALRISREQAHRIAADELGEPIVVAAKVLNAPRDLLYRLLLFVNTAVGHSVERVHALAELYDDIKPQAAQDLVAAWQALNAGNSAGTAFHRTAMADPAPGVRSTPAVQRQTSASKQIARRRSS
jgi:uncharacterized protein (DUF2336 family)